MRKVALLLFAAAALTAGWSFASDDGDVPPDARWRADQTLFFFRVMGTGEFNFRNAFARAQQLWKPAGFSFLMTSDRSGNTACQPRPPNIRIVNYASFGATVCGGNFDSHTLAVTKLFLDGAHAITAADITFNTAFRWQIYDGPLKPDFVDFQRVAAHELGHAAGLNHRNDTGSIMYRLVSNVAAPTPEDRQYLTAKYVSPSPPLPPDQFACSPSLPWSENVDFGTLQGTQYALGQCLDRTRPRTAYKFTLASARKIMVIVGADQNEINVILTTGQALMPWHEVNTGRTVKTSPALDLGAAEYTLTVLPASLGSNFTVEIRLM